MGREGLVGQAGKYIRCCFQSDLPHLANTHPTRPTRPTRPICPTSNWLDLPHLSDSPHLPDTSLF